ncbi:30S ribosomal protein S31, chloroplastic isoform X2 [Prosopis cineraria]|uniref:30S ribosomal protein S31, chloroplastic isoform X2 n=1 Tax=Prosopis cineraria TaxID=364024 RepID=UPI00240FDD42|nr:30S ribosomal protein S31, chloroplastic isoform X2 [Prosopis cineraria]
MASLVVGSAAPPLSSQFLKPSSSRLSFSRSETLTFSPFSPIPSLSASPMSSLSPVPSVYCGRGDKKTAKGKRFNHSFGNEKDQQMRNLRVGLEFIGTWQ